MIVGRVELTNTEITGFNDHFTISVHRKINLFSCGVPGRLPLSYEREKALSQLWLSIKPYYISLIVKSLRLVAVMF